jgi:hypothetical protein
VAAKCQPLFCPGSLNRGFGRPSFIGKIQFNGPVVPSTFTAIDQPVLFYVDASQTPIIQFRSKGDFYVNSDQNVTLVGYELDCNAAPCAAIATQ